MCGEGKEHMKSECHKIKERGRQKGVAAWIWNGAGVHEKNGFSRFLRSSRTFNFIQNIFQTKAKKSCFKKLFLTFFLFYPDRLSYPFCVVRCFFSLIADFLFDIRGINNHDNSINCVKSPKKKQEDFLQILMKYNRWKRL